MARSARTQREEITALEAQEYKKLIEALRCREFKPECGSSDCPYWSVLGCMDRQLMEDAADAIEFLIKDRNFWKDAAIKAKEEN